MSTEKNKAIEPRAQSFRVALITAATSFLSSQYVWGGQTDEELDCSGFIIQTFRRLGFPIEDMSAQQLFENMFTLPHPPEVGPAIEALFHRGADGKIDHVALVVGGAGDEFVVLHTTRSVGYVHFGVMHTSDDTIGPCYLDIRKLLRP